MYLVYIDILSIFASENDRRSYSGMENTSFAIYPLLS